MANPLKGEAKLGDYTLTINFGVFCELEGEMKLRTEEIIGLMVNGLTFTQLRTIIHAALEERHPGVSLKEVGDAIDAAGGYQGACEALSEALRAYTGDEEEKDENPPKAA